MANPNRRVDQEFTYSNPSPDNNSKQIALTALEAAIELRSLDPVALDISALSSVGDYFVIASGTSERHVQGVADKVREKLASEGAILLRSSGYESGEWIVLDYGDVVVHVFYEPSRHYYQLDQLWSKAAAIEPEGRLKEEAKKLRTGMLN